MGEAIARHVTLVGGPLDGHSLTVTMGQTLSFEDTENPGRVTALGIQPRLRVGIDAHHFIRTLSGAAVPPPRTAERPPDRKERGPRGSSRRTS